jgi:hypothetical protein
MLLAMTSSVSGCYRSAELELPHMQRIEPADEGLRVHYANRKPILFEEYDLVRIETRSASGGATDEFAAPMTALVEPKGLRVADSASEKRYAFTDVEAMTVVEHAPERPWIIVAATIGTGILGGIIVTTAPASATPTPNSDVWVMRFSAWPEPCSGWARASPSASR